MDRIRQLDSELLARLEQAMRALAPGLLERWAPGLSDQRIDELMDSVGMHMPNEGRAWWRWRNGGPFDGLPNATPYSLEDAIARSQRRRQDAMRDAQQTGLRVEQIWRPDWLSLFQIGGPDDMVLDCAGPIGTPAPVLMLDPESIGHPDYDTRVLAAPSLGTAISLFIDSMQRRRFDAELSIWR